MFDIKAPSGWVPTTFSVRDENHHKAIKRPVAHAFSMSSLKELEPMNDDCSAIFVRKLDGMIGQDIDLGTWLHVRAIRANARCIGVALMAGSGTLPM